MRAHRLALFAALAALGILLSGLSGPVASQAGAAPQAGPFAYSIELNADIDPATQRWIHNALNEAKDKHATVAIIRMDTPGGLDSSMRSIIKDILAAPMPVITYVYPNGSRAASAGMYIAQASDVIAMAPQTNIGSATPINSNGSDIKGALGRKVLNDSVAYVRALTSSHGRNANVAAQMVTKATNLTAQQALQQHVVDVIADNQQQLLQKLDGFQVKGPKAQTLHTAGIPVVTRDMPFQYDLLELLVNPTIAYLLLTAGFAGIVFEFFSPGMVAPGVLGAIALLLGFYGTAQLPVNAVGVLLFVVAIVLFVLEFKIGGHAVFAVGGIAALIASGLLLFNTGNGVFSIDVPVVIVAAIILGGLTMLAVSKAVAARHGPVSTGWEELLGREGVVRVPLEPVGQIFVQGALWRARLADADAAAPSVGDRVRVDSVDGLTLNVTSLGAPTDREESPAWQ
ncbi:MAG TPA: nodulation protein NfeD [Thermoleophilaceae bacterium]|jgi:membrane-bound serine protease (ClpP class)